MRRIVHISILAFFSTYVLSSPIVWATYFSFQRYFAEELCRNQVNPDCCGSCVILDIEDEAPKDAVPKIEVRTPELTQFVPGAPTASVSPDGNPLGFSLLSAPAELAGHTQDFVIPPEG